MTGDVRYSRPVATAARLGSHAADGGRFLEKRVLLMGESTVLAGANGRTCLLDSLRLLVRICRKVTVALPIEMTDLLDECRGLADTIAFDHDLVFSGVPDDLTPFDAILSVGTAARATLPWTVINANGWLARVSSGETPVAGACDQANPIGALAAACLGVGEVFKRLLRVTPTRGPLFDGLSFSLATYRAGETDPGPPLPTELAAELAVVGAGAIGNGIVHLLGRLPMTGTVAIVDGQAYGPENLGTCLLIGPGDVGADKAGFAAAHLTTDRLDAEGFREDIAVFGERLGTERAYPQAVLVGLDNIDARHAVQDWWPDLIIDGAIGDFGCQVSRHPWGEDVACLRCLFRQSAGEPAERRASRVTGLRPERTQRAFDALTEDDVRIAPVERQAWLRSRIGKPICSVVQEAVARQVSEGELAVGFAPSVPFVAGLSACMVVGEFVKSAMGWTTPLDTRFQFDALRGPAGGQELPLGRRPGCVCVTRAHNIERIRARRGGR